MREILFRGKTNNGEWVYGVPRTTYQGTTYIIPLCHEKDIKTERFVAIKVIPETVEQYTGLTDKNGTKIFEGDIVKIYDGQKAFVKFNKGEFCLKYEKIDELQRGMLHWYLADQLEVIGNIHDNPKLLGGD